METHAASVRSEKITQEQNADYAQREYRKKKTPAPTLEVINIEGCLSSSKLLLKM